MAPGFFPLLYNFYFPRGKVSFELRVKIKALLVRAGCVEGRVVSFEVAGTLPRVLGRPPTDDYLYWKHNNLLHPV